jgi:hypothetical protein
MQIILGFICVCICCLVKMYKTGKFGDLNQKMPYNLAVSKKAVILQSEFTRKADGGSSVKLLGMCNGLADTYHLHLQKDCLSEVCRCRMRGVYHESGASRSLFLYIHFYLRSASFCHVCSPFVWSDDQRLSYYVTNVVLCRKGAINCVFVVLLSPLGTIWRLPPLPTD